jgi:hypothetical protein
VAEHVELRGVRDHFLPVPTPKADDGAVVFADERDRGGRLPRRGARLLRLDQRNQRELG